MKALCIGTRSMTGGASMNAVMVAKHLISEGHACEVWFLFHTNDMDTEGVKTRVFFDRTPQGLREWFHLFRLFFSATKEYKADAIISFYPLTNILGSISKIFGTKRFIATQRNPVQKQSKPIFWMEMLCGATPLYNKNIAVSQFVANTCVKYPRFYKNKLEVIHNGVPPLPIIEIDDNTCREHLSLPNDTFLLGSIGRLDKQKNVKVLIEMMPKLPEMHLAIAGTGHLEDDLKDLAKRSGVYERVIFLGNLAGDEVTKFYKAIDVFTFATHFEGFGRTLVESFSVGTPVIATDLDVLKEVGKDAACYVSNNPDAWSSEILRLSKSNAERKELIQKGYDRANDFSLQRMLDGYTKAIHK